MEIIGEQLLAYYDADRQIMVLRESLAEGFKEKPQLLLYPDEASAVLVHELAHALQDQRLGLRKLYKNLQSTDESLAFQSLVEGDATLAMLAFTADLMGISTEQMLAGLLAMKDKLAKIAMASVPSKALRAAPAIVQAQMLAPYADGTIYAAKLFKQGGWRAINRRYRKPPQSMAEIFHPKQSRKKSKRIELPSGFADSTELVILHQDTLGELVFRVYFDQASDETEANLAAEGWLGDRVFVLKKANNDFGLLWISQWHSPSDLEQALRQCKK
ncbi:MAG: hypothetical protein IPJ88_09440 [Myxococcales bacterium]|nr:MAG: hypothetical protein IPJ88_09440 [Myxococcales bacterium]